MNKLKRVLATAGTSSVLALSMAGAAGASENHQQIPNINDSFNDTTTTTVDKSVNLDHCSYYNRGSQENSNSTAQSQSSNTVGSEEVEKGSSSSTSSSSNQTNGTEQSNTQNVSLDCSTNTTVAAAPGRGAAQVDVPKGAVHAGGGGGASTSGSSFASFLGLTGSVATLGAGVAMRKKGLLGL